MSWDRRLPLGGGLHLSGFSTGSRASCFLVHELRLYFDAGLAPPVDARTVCVTHCHPDHSKALPEFVAGLRRRGRPFPTVYVPIESVERFDAFLDASFRLGSHGDENGALRCTGVAPGDVLPLPNGYHVRCYDLHHGVPTRGYGLCQSRRRLLPELAGRSPAELAALGRRADIMQNHQVKIVAYVCDTSVRVFETAPELLEYATVVVECTFLKRESARREHVHWAELEPIVLAHPLVRFVLIHFSARYTAEDLAEFALGVPENVVVWM